MTDNRPHLWLDPTFGASGDMVLGALAGLLGSVEPLDRLAGLGIDGFRIRHDHETRGGLHSTRVEVEAEVGDVPHRAWSMIDQLIADADLPPAVIAGARRTFRRLGEVEAAQHGVSIDEVHFHEVGAVDAIVDIVGSWLLLDAIHPASTTVGPVGLGHGIVRSAHGLLPLPAPATAALLEGHPVRGLDVEAETCTPTGAALLVTMATETGLLPAGTIVGTARGAGRRDPDTHPNVLTAIAVAPWEDSPGGADERSVVIECNVDDVSGEVLAHTVDRLLASGADDAWIVPTVMKKGRPAHEVRVLCPPTAATRLRHVLLAETGSLGCRTIPVTKHVLERSFTTVDVAGHQVAIKVGPHGAKPEHDHLVNAAESTGRTLRDLAAEALEAWRRGASSAGHDAENVTPGG